MAAEHFGIIWSLTGGSELGGGKKLMKPPCQSSGTVIVCIFVYVHCMYIVT